MVAQKADNLSARRLAAGATWLPHAGHLSAPRWAAPATRLEKAADLSARRWTATAIRLEKAEDRSARRWAATAIRLAKVETEHVSYAVESVIVWRKIERSIAPHYSDLGSREDLDLTAQRSAVSSRRGGWLVDLTRQNLASIAAHHSWSV